MQLNHYNQQISTINQNPQLNHSLKESFEQQRHYLTDQMNALHLEIESYNTQIAYLNAQVSELNQLNSRIGQSVHDFNQRFQPRMFDKGSFNGRQIDIYQFESEDDLRLTLAHEFGHSLGLKHNEDSKALMFPIMQNQDMKNFRLTSADLELLNKR